MKKIISLLLVCISMITITVPVSAYNGDNPGFYYTTSMGNSFSLSDFVIYLEDFENVELETSQEVIDFMYEVGYARSVARDGHVVFMGYVLTEDEKELVIRHPGKGCLGAVAHKLTEDKVAELYPDTYDDDGTIANAFKHAYWTLMLCKYTGDTSFAIEFLTAHENFDTNDALNKNMDLYNNNIAHTYYVTNNLSWYSYTNSQLEDIVHTFIENGNLIYIIKNYVYVYRQVYYEATGVTRSYRTTGHFYAYTNSTIPYNVPEPIVVIIPDDFDGPVPMPNSLENSNYLE